jgi:hypothetical protein
MPPPTHGPSAPQGPPPVRLGDDTVVCPDVIGVAATITFDVGAREAVAEVTAEFVVEGDGGCPALDLRQALERLSLDGSPLPAEAFAHRDLGAGDGAAMRVLDQALAGGSRHRLDLGYRLGLPDAEGAQPIGWQDAGVRFDFWMSDLHPGRYLEMWLPANLCHDRFALSVEVEVVGGVHHGVVTNGTETALGARRWRIEYPAHFTALSPMLVLAPSTELEVRRTAVALAGRTRPLEVVTAKHSEVVADLAACEADVTGWLAGNAARYGPWVHGDRFTGVVWGPERGMEYDGATTASVAALEHEVFHSWFGRGVKPARASDGWIDEAWTSWATSTRRSEEGRFAQVALDLDQPPVVLCPPHPWSRFTPVESYTEGARLFAGVAHLIGGPARLRSAMASWYRASAGGLVTTEGLEAHLTDWSGIDLDPWFARYVHGRGRRLFP